MNSIIEDSLMNCFGPDLATNHEVIISWLDLPTLGYPGCIKKIGVCVENINLRNTQLSELDS